jgi:uncharacterized protein (DUF885 family)
MRGLVILVGFVVLAVGSAACGGTQKAAEQGNEAAAAPAPSAAEELAARRAAFAALMAEEWEHRLRSSPEFASILGDRRYNDRWTDMSLEAIAARLEEGRAFLARFEAIDTTGFPEHEALDQQLMVRSLREGLDDARFEDWLMPVNQFSGVHLLLPQAAAIFPFVTVKDYEDYITRLEAVPALMAQAIALMRAGLEKELMPPRFVLEQAVTQAAGLARGPADESPFVQPLQRFPEGFSEADQERLRARMIAAVRDQVLPAYVELTAFLRDEYAPRGRAEPGVWALPDGEARYAAAVARMTTTSLSPDEIHELGLREVARIEAEMAEIGRTLGFKDLAAFRKHLRKNKKLYPKSRQEILDRYQRHTDAMYAKLPELFGRLPRQEMIIEPIEAFREKEAAGAEYMQGARDGSRPGVVRVNTYEPTKRSWIDMESTAYHEGVPGHHMQIAIQQELEEMSPQRQQGYYGAFQEGWALYSEQLGKEVGFFEDPYSDYGRLQDEILRAIRLVVDTGFHHRRWSRQQVVDFFRAHSTIDEVTIQSETDRYMVWPGQALSYKVGQLTILRLREQAAAALGDAFDLRAFHDEILGAGALPLDVLETRIAAWVAAQLRAR